MSKFEDNGGYYIDGVPYMDCKYTGEPVRNVSTDCKYVISDKALQSRMYKMFPEDFEEKASIEFIKVSNLNALRAKHPLKSVHIHFAVGVI